MSTNICKECGKKFEAKSPRVAYCSDTHYRPCPVCGKPVEAKYLSDPARKCEECRHKTKSEVQHITYVKNEAFSIKDDVREYMGPEACGFKHHKYIISIDKDEYGYQVFATKDVTEDIPVSLMMPFSSKISIEQQFIRTI